MTLANATGSLLIYNVNPTAPRKAKIVDNLAFLGATGLTFIYSSVLPSQAVYFKS